MKDNNAVTICNKGIHINSYIYSIKDYFLLRIILRHYDTAPFSMD